MSLYHKISTLTNQFLKLETEEILKLDQFNNFYEHHYMKNCIFATKDKLFKTDLTEPKCTLIYERSRSF